MWSLLVAGEGRPPDLSGRPAAEWRDSHGEIVARAFSSPGRWVVEVGGCARYWPGEGRQVHARAEAGVDRASVEVVFAKLVAPFAAHCSGADVLHASAAVVDGRVVAFTGPTRSGKSTLAHAFARNGHETWADDAVAWRTEGSRIRAEPLPFSLTLRRDVVEQVAERHVAAFSSAADAAPLDVAAVIVLEPPCARRSGDAAAGEARRLGPGQAARRVLPQMYRYRLDDADEHERVVRACLDLVQHVPVLALPVRPLDELWDLAAAAERAARTLTGGPQPLDVVAG